MAQSLPKRAIRCYLCGHGFDVSTRTMSVPCPKCHKALKVEDVNIKTYLPVNDLQTCGKITVTPNGRVVAKLIQAGDGIECEGTLEGAIKTDGDFALGPKASWKGKSLHSKRLSIAEGAKLVGYVKVPAEPIETIRSREQNHPTNGEHRNVSKNVTDIPGPDRAVAKV